MRSCCACEGRSMTFCPRFTSNPLVLALQVHWQSHHARAPQGWRQGRGGRQSVQLSRRLARASRQACELPSGEPPLPAGATHVEPAERLSSLHPPGPSPTHIRIEAAHPPRPALVSLRSATNVFSRKVDLCDAAALDQVFDEFTFDACIHFAGLKVTVIHRTHARARATERPSYRAHACHAARLPARNC